MPYKVKDVTIDLASAAAVQAVPQFCFYGGTWCNYTWCGYCSHCTWGYTGCFLGCTGRITFPPQQVACEAGTGIVCGVTLGDPGPMAGGDPAALGALKVQLQQALKDVEQRELVLANAMQPQTIAEVDEAEKKLKEALEELSKRRAELHKEKKG